MEPLFITWQILRNWWWFFFPIILFFPFKLLYLWWIKWEVWYKKINWILLEIKPPEEILKPFKAMEDIINVLWPIYDSPNWRERWCEGQPPSFAFWLSFEIASIGGIIHFYIRINKDWKDMVEATIYSQYPEMEISVVEDYTKNVPQNVPNKKFDLYSEDFTVWKDDVYPIKTYSMFFEKPEEEKRVMEEKRLDPLNSLLEALAQLKPGEQYWLQIVATPILNHDIPIFTRGREVANKLAKRPEAKKSKPFWQEAIEVLIPGKPAEVPEEEVGLIAPELRLTPGEKEILKGVETKIEKYCYNCWIRIVYLFKKDEPYFLGNYKIGRSYFTHFTTSHLNALVYMGPTRTRIHYWLRDRRLYLRKRKNFRNYVDRFPPYFPWNMEGRMVHPFDFGFYPKGPGLGKGTFVLSSEELATIFHFPAKITVPAVPRVEVKKVGPPPGLPIE